MEASLPVSDPIRLYVVMGVAGCGKSTIAEGLAARLGGTYLDGDSFHPPGNIAKMAKGTPLTDEDRWPWLETFAKAIAAETGVVFGACSSLKRSYRDHIRVHAHAPVCFIYLDGDRDLIARRLNERTGHFMPASLLDSQFATLEPPSADEMSLTLDIAQPVDAIIEDALAELSPPS